MNMIRLFSIAKRVLPAVVVSAGLAVALLPTQLPQAFPFFELLESDGETPLAAAEATLANLRSGARPLPAKCPTIGRAAREWRLPATAAPRSLAQLPWYGAHNGCGAMLRC